MTDLQRERLRKEFSSWQEAGNGQVFYQTDEDELLKVFNRLNKKATTDGRREGAEALDKILDKEIQRLNKERENVFDGGDPAYAERVNAMTGAEISGLRTAQLKLAEYKKKELEK